MTLTLCRKALLIPMLVLTSSWACALTPYHADYQMSWDVGIKLKGTASQRLSPDEDLLKIEQTANASLGSIEETSWFRQDATGRIFPLEFVRKTQILGRGKEQQYRFNWNQFEVQMDDELSLDIQQGVFDPLTLQLALRQALSQGTALQISLADRGKIKAYPMENLGLRTLDTASGPLSAVQLRYRKNADSHTDMWFDPSREHLMVALKATRDGKTFELQLTSAEFFPKDATPATPQ